MSNSQRTICSELLQAMLDNKKTPQDVINDWPKGSSDDLVEHVYCLLFHYRDDSDIRQKDQRYFKYQEAEVKGWIAELQE